MHASQLVILLGALSGLPSGCNVISRFVRLPACARKTGVVYERKSKKQAVPCDYQNLNRPSDGCVTQTITCGTELLDSTHGGTANFSDDFYRSKFCMPFTYEYEGPERIYTFKMPAATDADIWLDADCEDLDLVAFVWDYEGACPSINHLISVCEADASAKGGHVHLVTLNHPANYLVVVDGKAGHRGPFRLTVECKDH
jgi:hypothetical protein